MDTIHQSLVKTGIGVGRLAGIWSLIGCSPDIPPASAAHLDELHHLTLAHAKLAVAEGAVVGQDSVQLALGVRREAQPVLPHTVVIGLSFGLNILQWNENYLLENRRFSCQLFSAIFCYYIFSPFLKNIPPCLVVLLLLLPVQGSV